MNTSNILVITIAFILLYFGYLRHKRTNEQQQIDSFVRLPMCYNTGAYDYRYPATCYNYDL